MQSCFAPPLYYTTLIVIKHIFWLRWLLLSIFADFEQFKKLSSYFADFEQVLIRISHFVTLNNSNNLVVILLTLNKS